MTETIADFHENLGPNWEEGHAISERFMEKFKADHFEPLLETFTDKFRDKLWTDITAFLMSDTESNLGSEIQRRVDTCVQAILAGNQSVIEFYGLHKYDGQAARAAVALAIPEPLQVMRVAELEAEVKHLRDCLNRRY